MSETARPDEIDALVSSVRDLVAHREPARAKARTKSELLILTQSYRVDGGGALETPLEYALATDDTVSNVLSLDTHQQPQRAGLEATIAELEAAITSQPEDWEPDEGEIFAQDAWAVSAFQAQADDSPEPSETADETPAMSAQMAREVETALGVSAMTSEVLPGVDADTLRPLVVEIIREELAGELGEKITRNVRKLVRREINRVLASRDL